MRRALVSLVALLALTTAAAAQLCGPTNPNCIVPNRPPGTNDQTAANTAFVQGALVGTALVVGTTPVSNGTPGGILYQGAGNILQNNGPLISAISNPTTNGQWSIGSTTVLGAILIGQGSTDDVQLQNKNGTGVLSIATSATVPTLNGITGSTQCLQVNSSGVMAGSGGACGGGTPGGANTNIQFNNSGALGGDAGFTYLGNGQVTHALGTITTNLKALTITGTWNAGGVTFDAPLLLNITNTASANGSLLADFQVGGTSLYTFGLGTTNNTGLSINFAGTASNPALWFNPPTGGSVQNGIYITNVGSGSSTFTNLMSGGTDVLTLNGFSLGASVRIGSQTTIAWLNGTDPANASNAADTGLYRDAVASVLGLGNGTNHLGFRVYNTTDHSGDGTAPVNFERLSLDWTTTSNLGTLATQKGGTGTARGIAVSPANGHTTFSGGSAPTANTCAGFSLGTGSSDGQGSVTYTSATTCSITFGTAYTNAPFCTITPGSAASTVEVVPTTSGFTATFGTAQTVFQYHCSGV
jgi:hypothetical protein